MKPTPEFWRLLVLFAFLGGLALIAAAGGFEQ